MTTAQDSARGRIAVVTGGAGAIGTAITKALQEAGHRTVVLDRDADIACDLGSEASTRAAAAVVLERYGRCDVFVHCAAAFDQVTLADADAATWRHVQAVNGESAASCSSPPTRSGPRPPRCYWPTSPARARCSGSCAPWPPPSAPTASPC